MGELALKSIQLQAFTILAATQNIVNVNISSSQVISWKRALYKPIIDIKVWGIIKRQYFLIYSLWDFYVG